MKRKLIRMTMLGLSLLLLISIPASALDASLERNLKYYPAAAACLSSLNLPGVAGAGLVDMGAMYMECSEIEDSMDAELQIPSISASDCLEATEDDFEELKRMLGYCEEPLCYTSASILNPATSDVVADALRNAKIYQFFYGTDGYEEMLADELPDFSHFDGMEFAGPTYNSYPYEKMEWILDNIFLSRDDHRTGLYTDGHFQWGCKDGRYYGCTSGEFSGGVYDCEDGWGFDGLSVINQTEDGMYHITCNYHNQREDQIHYQYWCALRYIDGKRYWTFLWYWRVPEYRK